MQSSEDGNRPRWRGQPGFFEIWFLVVFDPSGGRAWWFRYTTFAPRFAEDADARLEATAVRLRRRLAAGLPAPALVPVWARVAGGELDWCELPAVLWNRVDRPGACELRVQAWSPTRALTARAWCDPRTLAGWLYRDPAGWDVHVAQSDVASCEVEVVARPHLFAPWRRVARLTVSHGAALEFHAPEPLPEVRYLPW